LSSTETRSDGHIAHARYVTALLGAHGESRRATLRHAIREADLHNLRETLKELDPAVEDLRGADSTAPAMRANEMASIRPWTNHQSAPPLPLHSDGISPYPLFSRVAKLISMSRSAGSRRVFLLGMAVLFLTVVYGLNARRPATDAIASAASPPVPASVLPALASPTPSECTPYPAPSSAPASSPQPAEVIVRGAHRETLRPPRRLPKGPKSVALPAARPNEEEVDVGF